MNVCKYCKKYGVCSLMTKLGLIGKHIVFFIDLIAGNLLISPRKCL